MIKILVTGVGSLIGQGIVKSLNNSCLKYRIIGTDYFASAVGLYWVDKGYLLPDILNPKVDETEWIDALIKIIKTEKIDIILPGLDFEIPILARNKSVIEKLTSTSILVSSNKVVSIGNDKWETVKYLKKHGFNYPKSCLPNKLNIFLKNNQFPLIVKPRFGHTSENVFKVTNISELNRAIETCPKPIIQEYLSNHDLEYTCGSTFFNGKILSLISLRRTLKNGNTQLAFSENTIEIDEHIKKLTLSIKPYGPINFQLRISDQGPVVFEINPRFSGTTPIRALFGVNEVENIVKKIIDKDSVNVNKKKLGVVIRYFDDQIISLNQYKEYLR